MRTVLILGAKGMLGQALVRCYGEDEGYQVIGWDIEDIDVTDFPEAERKIREVAPAVILNAIAYNAVDQCEEHDDEYRKASLLNAEVPEFLARLAQAMEAAFVHYSTDYVFDGESESGYAEDALPHPLSRYGQSKREGEERVIAIGGVFYIIRLSKLFGRAASSAIAKKSFFEKMLEVAEGKTEVSVVDGEKSCFTYAPDLALATKVLEQHVAPYGIYHLVNAGTATWYEAAQELFRLAGVSVAVKPVAPEAFPRPARRPRCSELLNTKFIPLRPYTEALEEFLKQER
ncbi:MAG: dTDP-4-dehydrorhamnose reductase [Candidatus Moranbacteria bacterium]|nr:dTDP-4-dehydrorhamnose reductase [Candidatus Moranbacteria bacterium]MBP6033942.1 dTDP-4-dehydrorhamnose reductase [Candidatus Moranbacteria bacterium]MBP7695599.1 dTDP-4-dehydrorhamnose reductase [Candidatus Moranbacteria bacterium]